MKIVYKMSLFFAVLLAVSACKLDQFSTSTITIDDPKEVFKTYEDATRLSNGLNSYFRATTYGVFAQTSDIQSDLFNASITFGNRSGAPHTMNNQFNASDYDIRAIWDGYYSGITNYNYFIENIHYVQADSKLSSTQQLWLQVWKGNAFFYRAYSYFELAKKFCAYPEGGVAATALGLPYVTKYNIHAKPARETLQKTLDLIEADIDSAAKYLAPLTPAVRSSVPTVDAVNALRARFYLWTQNWGKAIESADLVINSKAGYRLAATEAEMQQEFYNDNGPEDILQLFSSLTESPRSISIYIGEFAGADGGKYYYNLPDFLPTDKVMNFYEETDTRSKVFINYLGMYNGRLQDVYYFAKFRGNPALTSAPYFACRNKAKIFRVAEMYLIKAEAQVKSGGDAKTTLNDLQTARKATLTSGTLADVQHEWARETVGEGMRMECLKRWKLGFKDRLPYAENDRYVVSGAGYTEIELKADSHMFTWPIPTNDITYNENLKQNPGW